ncbi:MAG TPA: ABC transporter ATP-binding protein [Longimicrobiales bacterium]|nr:ABC transporter ATP-binding protein [Longimicrobiales bacterium]
MRLDVEGVSKRYKGSGWGLQGFSLSLEPGVIALLGPNGAGKSTLMRILAGITRPTSGRVLWNGVDVGRNPDAVRAVLGYLPQDFGVYPHLSAEEFLEYIAALKGIEARVARKRIRELLAALNLAGVRGRPLGGFSGGMKQRVGIAQALLNDPQILIVDEPTTGLDPEERVRFRSLLTDLAGERIVLLSTHIVSDAEATANSIAVMAKGRLLSVDSPEGMLRSMAGIAWEWVVPSDQLAAVRRSHVVSQTVRRADGVHVRIVADESPHDDARATSPNLEDAYLYVTSGAAQRATS